MLKTALANGFQVLVFHVNVNQPEVSIQRVAARSSQGGHGVPEEKIRARYERNQPLIKEAVLMATHSVVFDNSVSGRYPQEVVRFRAGKIIHAVSRLEMPTWASRLYAPELQIYRGSKR